MHRVSLEVFLQAILVRLCQPRRGERDASIASSAAIAKKARAEGAEWPETQPWCHQQRVERHSAS